MMRLFSSRRQSITADLRTRAAQFEQRYGRAPSQRELAQLAQSSNFATRAAKQGTLDFAQLHAGWADKLARTLGIPLASVAPSVWHSDTDPHADAPDSPAAELELARAAQKAVALAQQEKSTWTRADVIKHLGRVLSRSGRNPAAAAELLEDLADRALRREFEPVLCLEAPELAEVPRSLLRADGRGIYQRHGGIRYATRAQLVMEERMLTQARAPTAPRLTHAQAAHALGANPSHLNDALTGHAHDTHDQRTQTGLREDQAAAALSALTDGTRVSACGCAGAAWRPCAARPGSAPPSRCATASPIPASTRCSWAAPTTGTDCVSRSKSTCWSWPATDLQDRVPGRRHPALPSARSTCSTPSTPAGSRPPSAGPRSRAARTRPRPSRWRASASPILPVWVSLRPVPAHAVNERICPGQHRVSGSRLKIVHGLPSCIGPARIACSCAVQPSSLGSGTTRAPERPGELRRATARSAQSGLPESQTAPSGVMLLR